MKLMYSRHDIFIYHTEAEAGFRELVPQFDVLIADPPYGISHPCNYKTRGRGLLAKNRDWPQVAGDNMPFDPAWILSLNKPTCLWGANYFADKLPSSSGWLVWDKLRPDAMDQATCELAWTNYVKGVRRFAHLWNGCMKASERRQAFHPMQKPVALCDWVLANRWTPSGTVFDPYMGAGPMALACFKAKRQFVGFEIELSYIETAIARIEREATKSVAWAAQGTLTRRE